jgi:hypothetical protein
VKFIVSFITIQFQERNVNESAELTSSVFKENVSELELEIVNLKTDLSSKTRLNDILLEFSAVCTVSYSETSVIKGDCVFPFYLGESWFSTVKLLKSKYRSLTDKHLSDCMEWLFPNTLLTIISWLKRCSVKYNIEFRNFVRMDCFPKKTLHILRVHCLE